MKVEFILTREQHDSSILCADVFLLGKIEVWVQAGFIFRGMTDFANQWDAEYSTNAFSDSYSKAKPHDIMNIVGYCSICPIRALIKG